MKSGLSIIIEREYMSRVKRKSFIITTILMPVLMIAISFAPALVMLFSSPEDRSIAVIDDTGRIAQRLENNDEVSFVSLSEPLDSLRDNPDYQSILVIGAKAIDKPEGAITLYTHGAPVLMTDAYIQGQLENAIRDIRLESYDITNLKQILKEVEVDVNYATIRIDEEEESETSAGLSYALGLIMDMILYMFILIYGQMVMNSIIEEKNNRVLELVVSSVKPTSLMLGKIAGIGLVAVTQIMIWAVLLGACWGWGLPMLASMPSASGDAELAGILGQLSDGSFLASLLVYTLLFFIGGYFFYSAIYAAIGSAVDNIQDASQLSSIATVPVILGIVCSMSILNNPGSTLAFWISVIPFTSPMCMMSRLPFGVPTWEIIVSLVVLYLSFLFMIWVCAKIYRVGIFMYGKKPTIIEIIRWSRYK